MVSVAPDDTHTKAFTQLWGRKWAQAGLIKGKFYNYNLQNKSFTKTKH